MPISRPRQLIGFPATSAKEAKLSHAPLDHLRAKSCKDVNRVRGSPGQCHLVLHRGKSVLVHSDGWADKKQKVSFGPDTLCRLHGATRALVVGAFLTLVDKGQVSLEDPVVKFIPFSDRVRVGCTGRTRPAKVKPTIRHLLSMTAGLEDPDCLAYKELMCDVRTGQVVDLEEFAARVAEVPLEHEPGSYHHDHSLCTDILGHVCEVICGKTLDVFVRDHLLLPLGMKDTHFIVPASKRRRSAAMYDVQQVPEEQQRRGRLEFEAKLWEPPDGDVSASGIFQSGGGITGYANPGMWSTVRDFARFCQMLLDDGRAPGGRRRVLKEATARALWCDSLIPFARSDGRIAGFDESARPQNGVYWEGWSLLNVAQDHEKPPRTRGSPRMCHSLWMYGGGGPCWVIDKPRQLVAVTFHQCYYGGGPLWNEKSHYGEPYCYPFARQAIEEGSSVRQAHTKRLVPQHSRSSKRARVRI